MKRAIILAILIAAVLPLGVSAQKQVTVLDIPYTLADEFMQQFVAGVRLYAKENKNVTLLVEDPQGKVENEISILESYRSKPVDAVVLYAIDPFAVAPVVKELKQKGIKFVAASARFEGQDVGHVTDEWDGGSTAGKMFVEWWTKNRPGEKAHILSLDFPSNEFANRRNVAFLAYVKQVLGTLVDVVASQETKGDAELGQKVTETMLIAHPEINFIFGVNDSTINGAMAAVENAGRHDIAYAGIGGEPAAVKALQKPLYPQKGGWAFDVGGKMNPVSWGYNMVDAAVKLARGQKVVELDFSWTVPVWRENVKDYSVDLNQWRTRAGLKPLQF